MLLDYSHLDDFIALVLLELLMNFTPLKSFTVLVMLKRKCG